MKSTFSIFFALLLLTTQVGVSLATHFCGGEVFKSSISIIGDESPTCDMQDAGEMDCTNQSGMHNKSCCEDQAVNVQIEDQYDTSSSTALNNSLVFLASFSISYIYAISPTDANVVKADYYDPPVLELDIPVLIQSFLI